MCVVVASDLRTRRVDGCKHEGVEICVTSLEAMFRYGEVGRGEKVKEGKVGHAKVDAIEVVVEGHAVVVGDEQEGKRWRRAQ